jgi:uncharacterized protein YyaL (SSP411 family)
MLTRRIGSAAIVGVLLATVFAAAQTALQPAATPGPSLTEVLERLSTYLNDYSDKLSRTVAAEHYKQTSGSGPTYVAAVLDSEFGIVKVPNYEGWLGFRDVLKVNGRPIQNRETRVQDLLLNPAPIALDQARRIAEESARLNVGTIQRNINSPALVLELFDRRNRPRLRFTKTSEATIDQARVWVVRYKEKIRPTLILSLQGRDVPMEGVAWIEPTSGALVRAEVNIKDFIAAPNLRTSKAQMRVYFARDPRLKFWVPARLTERYEIGGLGIMTGDATYSNYREFGTETREEFGQPRYTNRLIDSKSPYLQLHAHNPVDWFPWGQEAFDKARREGKPLLVSIGYSTCHWCHVMEEESFSDPAIAAIMNEYFVCIKVDREERPDIDRVYMSFLQAATGRGGWPMTIFLTPDLKPFYGGTYYPPEDRGGRPGLRTVIEQVHQSWTTQHDQILQSAEKAAQSLSARMSAAVGTAKPGPPVLDGTYQRTKAGYDAINGGFGKAPKFPRPVVFNFLLRYYARTGDKAALEMTLATLRAMARGGIHDQLGGGFHRYSTDASWHVPHFEKMLYDQAQLAVSYAEAYQITKDAFFADVARDILDYVLRDMRGPEGGFYSAEDADSLVAPDRPERAEGAFYVWSADEIRQVLGDERAEIFAFAYGVAPSGNVPAQQDVQGELKGRNVLMLQHTVAESAARFKKSEPDMGALLAAARKELATARAGRPHPPLDDKVLVAWNGLMISAFARAAQVLDEPRYADAARASAAFVESRMYDSKTNLLQRRYRDGAVEIDAMAEDYAFLIQGVLDLYETSFEVKWLSWAVRLQEQQDALFWDGKAGGYFATRADAAHVLVRMKENFDGDLPAASSVAAMNLLRLWQMTDRTDWRDKADATFAAFAGRLGSQGTAVPGLVSALDFSLSKPRQILIAGDPGAADTRAMLRLVHERFIPNKILLVADGGAGQQQLAQWLSVVESVSRKDGRATAYICEDYVCQLPTADLVIAAQLLDGTWKPGSK